MHMIDRFQEYLQNPLSVRFQDKVLLAVSGGRDSMLMAYLFLESGYNCVILHCNFHLRGAESDLDEQLVVAFAAGRGVPCVVEHFDTQQYAEKNQVSIQMAARDLRYSWFEQKRIALEADCIAVGQHQNDHIETAFLNLSRGTGITGLQGILPRRGHIIRPLLFAGSQEITEEVNRLAIPYRDDQSNFSTKYVRNKLRLDILPKFKELTSEFDKIMVENMDRFRQTAELLDFFVKPIRDKLFQQEGEMLVINKKAISEYIENVPLLYELFREYGFTVEVLSDLQANFNSTAGKVFQSASFEMLLDRQTLCLRPREITRIQDAVTNLQLDMESVSFQGGSFSMHTSTDLHIYKDVTKAQVDFDLLIFPLHLRLWQRGDVFYPLGMAGKKKVSDFFIQQKVNLFQKKRVPILVNGIGDLIWIANYRLDNRYRVTENTKKVYIIESN
ncbi:MAG: tRNA lysidine(34) synthetase TilS [Sphingobacterium sp.]